MAPSRPPLTGSNRLVYTVPEAGRLLGLGRNAAYDAARRGDIPTIRLGRLLRVPKAALHKLVGAEPSYSRTVGEAQDTADNTDEDSRESNDEEAVVQVTLHQSPYGASIVDSAPDQQDCGPFHIPRRSWRRRREPSSVPASFFDPPGEMETISDLH
jgi:excisionase family DNA binding protein